MTTTRPKTSIGPSLSWLIEEVLGYQFFSRLATNRNGLTLNGDMLQRSLPEGLLEGMLAADQADLFQFLKEM